MVFFGKLAEIAGQYLRKGSQVYVEAPCAPASGRTRTARDRYTTEIRADEMKMLGSRQGHGRRRRAGPQTKAAMAAVAMAAAAGGSGSGGNYGGGGGFGDGPRPQRPTAPRSRQVAAASATSTTIFPFEAHRFLREGTQTPQLRGLSCGRSCLGCDLGGFLPSSRRVGVQRS